MVESASTKVNMELHMICRIKIEWHFKICSINFVAFDPLLWFGLEKINIIHLRLSNKLMASINYFLFINQWFQTSTLCFQRVRYAYTYRFNIYFFFFVDSFHGTQINSSKQVVCNWYPYPEKYRRYTYKLSVDITK